MSRVSIFVVQIVWLVVLGSLAAAFFIQRSLIPFSDFLGPVPLAVIWFGALGAVLISLTGIVEHANDWDKSMALWHLSRPLVGASLAVVGVLIVQAGVLAAGSTPGNAAGSTPVLAAVSTPGNAAGSVPVLTATSTPGNATGSAPVSGIPKNVLYYLVAFLVGYREETFRELIKRLVDLIFTPATAKAATTITGLTPVSGPAAGGIPIIVSGSGFTGATAVTFGSSSAVFTVNSDNQITATLPAGTAGQQVVLTVKGKSGAASASFQY